MIELNNIYNIDCLDGLRLLKNESIDVIIADPPYFEIKGKFDFTFKSFDDYLKIVEEWVYECQRVLKSSGTLLWWGHANNVAYSQVIIDKYLNLENNIVWSKPDCQTRRGIAGYRLFAPVTERILMYSKECKNKNNTPLTKIHSCKNNFLPIKTYLREQKKASNLTSMQIDKVCGETATARHCFNGNQWTFIKEKSYISLQNATSYFLKPYNELLKPYNELLESYNELLKSYSEILKSYNELRRPFNNYLKLTDVIVCSQQSHITKKYKHPTQKPIKLTKDLISTISRNGDIVLIPFVGAGTEVEACIETGRKYIGFELDKGYFDIAKKREHEALKNKDNNGK